MFRGSLLTFDAQHILCSTFLYVEGLLYLTVSTCCASLLELILKKDDSGDCWSVQQNLLKLWKQFMTGKNMGHSSLQKNKTVLRTVQC